MLDIPPTLDEIHLIKPCKSPNIMGIHVESTGVADVLTLEGLGQSSLGESGDLVSIRITLNLYNPHGNQSCPHH